MRKSLLRRISEPLSGPDATDAELAVGWGTALAAASAQIVWASSLGQWSALQTTIAVLFAFDIGGGVVVNATRAGRRWWHRPGQGPVRHLTFCAAHLHPFVIALCWPGYSWAQAAALYGSMLAFAAIVLWVPRYLMRPVAFGLTAIGLVLGATMLRAPQGLVWLPLLYYVKLIAAHLVSDE